MVVMAHFIQACVTIGCRQPSIEHLTVVVAGDISNLTDREHEDMLGLLRPFAVSGLRVSPIQPCYLPSIT
jgi:hypothetical protein